MKYDDLELTTLKGSKVIIHEPEDTGLGGAFVEGLGETNAWGMTLVEGSEIIKFFESKGIDYSHVDPDFIYHAFEITSPINTCIVLSKKSSTALCEFGEKRRNWRMEQIRKEMAEKEQKLEEILPGLSILKAAHSELIRYNCEFEKMMDHEHNDGSNPPEPLKYDIDTLTVKYPLAALYLKAEDFEGAANYKKASAGTKAKRMLENGANLAEAKAVLDNWIYD